MRINAFFDGGGILGISYIGAYSALSDYGYYIDKACGISVGAIIASLIVSGYTANELTSLLASYDDFSFFKQKTEVGKNKYVGKPLSLLLKKGIYDSGVINKFVDRLLRIKNIKIFKDVNDRLKIIAADFTTKKMLILPEDLHLYGYNPLNFNISNAVQMSCAIPLFYTPYILKGKYNSHYIIDGCVVRNIPTNIFTNDFVDLTLRFKACYKARDLKVKKQININEKTYLVNIPIENKLKPIDFDLSREQVIYLYKQGYKACYKLIKKIDNKHK